MSMCLVLEWSTGFFAMQMEDMLSTKMGILRKLNPARFVSSKESESSS
jgi:hypothetical protein